MDHTQNPSTQEVEAKHLYKFAGPHSKTVSPKNKKNQKYPWIINTGPWFNRTRLIITPETLQLNQKYSITIITNLSCHTAHPSGLWKFLPFIIKTPEEDMCQSNDQSRKLTWGTWCETLYHMACSEFLETSQTWVTSPIQSHKVRTPQPLPKT